MNTGGGGKDRSAGVHLFKQQADDIVFMILPPLMALIFGVYFIFFSKEKLPEFYDQYKVNFYSDGIFRMNVPGVCFNNSNWPHILNAVRAWACLTLGGWVVVYAAARGPLVRLGKRYHPPRATPAQTGKEARPPRRTAPAPTKTAFPTSAGYPAAPSAPGRS